MSDIFCAIRPASLGGSGLPLPAKQEVIGDPERVEAQDLDLPGKGAQRIPALRGLDLGASVDPFEAIEKDAELQRAHGGLQDRIHSAGHVSRWMPT